MTVEVAEQIARRFHEVYDARADIFGWSPAESTRVAWEDLPEENRNLMVSVVDILLANAVISPGAAVGLDPGPLTVSFRTDMTDRELVLLDVMTQAIGDGDLSNAQRWRILDYLQARFGPRRDES